MDGDNNASDHVPQPEEARGGEWPSFLRLPWVGTALLVVAVVGALAKVFGVLVTPGMAGIASQSAVDNADFLASTFTYAFALLAVGLVAAGAYELSVTRGIGIGSRGVVIGLSALVVAFAAPSISHRLHPIPTLGLTIVTTIVTIVACVNALRAAHTRVLGAVLALFALAALLRPIAWELTMVAGEQASIGIYGVGKLLAGAALVFQAFATLLAAAWLGTRSPLRGRILANGAVVIAFAITWLAARDTTTPSAATAVLRASLSHTISLPLPEILTSISAFLVPATTLLALVAVVQRAAAKTVLASLALALLSQGALDVPVQALAMAAACQWGMLAMADPRSLWSTLTRGREGNEKRESGQRFGV